MAKSPIPYLDHIDEALANIKADLECHDFDSFCADRKTQQLVERNLGIISEASRHIPDVAKAGETEIPWRAIANIGNVVRHAYHKVAEKTLWETCTEDLESLKAAIARIRVSI